MGTIVTRIGQSLSIFDTRPFSLPVEPRSIPFTVTMAARAAAGVNWPLYRLAMAARYQRGKAPRATVGTLPYPGPRPGSIDAGHSHAAPCNRIGTMVPSRSLRVESIHNVIRTRHGIGRFASLPAFTTPGAQAATALALVRIAPPVTPTVTDDSLRTTVRPIGAMPGPVMVVTAARDAATPELQAEIHCTAVLAIIGTALDGTLTPGILLPDFHLPCPHGGPGVRVIRRFNGATIERSYRYPVTRAEIIGYLNDDRMDAEDAADIRAAVKAQNDASAEMDAAIDARKAMRAAGIAANDPRMIAEWERGKAAEAAGATVAKVLATIGARERKAISRARATVARLLESATPLSPADASRLSEARLTLRGYGVGESSTRAAKAARESEAARVQAEGATAPTDGPLSRGESIIRPGTRHTGRHVPMAGR